MAFRFRFKSLLQKREYTLKEAQIAFAAARGHCEEVKRRLSFVRQTYKRSWQELQEKQQRGIEARYFLEHFHYLESLEQQLLSLERKLNEARMEMEKRQSAMLQRDREVKIMEELRDRERQMHSTATLKREHKHMDEIAVFKHCRSRSL